MVQARTPLTWPTSGSPTRFPTCHPGTGTTDAWLHTSIHGKQGWNAHRTQTRRMPQLQGQADVPNIAAPEKQANTVTVANRAVGTTLGSITSARITRVPRLPPLRAPYPHSIATRCKPRQPQGSDAACQAIPFAPQPPHLGRVVHLWVRQDPDHHPEGRKERQEAAKAREHVQVDTKGGGGDSDGHGAIHLAQVALHL